MPFNLAGPAARNCTYIFVHVGTPGLNRNPSAENLHALALQVSHIRHRYRCAISWPNTQWRFVSVLVAWPEVRYQLARPIFLIEILMKTPIALNMYVHFCGYPIIHHHYDWRYRDNESMRYFLTFTNAQHMQFLFKPNRIPPWGYPLSRGLVLH